MRMRETAALIWEGLATSATLLRAAILGEEGQTLAEYSLIITVIAVGVVVTSMTVFRTALAGAFEAAAGCISIVSC